MKRLISLMTAAVLVFSVVTASAANVSDTNVTSLMAEMNIMSGFPDGEFYPDLPVTRAQFAKIAVNASKYKNMVAHGMATSPFADVSYTHWAAPYIKTATSNKLIQGYPDSTFLPENSVTLAEAVTVAVKLIGYTDSDFSVSWPYGQMGVADNIGLLDNISAGMNDPLTRGEVRTLIYNTLRTNLKDSNTEYISILGYSVIEDVTLIATNKENSSVGLGKVYTSSGTYEITEDFNYEDVGYRGDIVVKEGKIVLFFKGGQTERSYAIYSTTDDDVVVYGTGGLTQLGLDKNVKAYYNLQETTLGNILQGLGMGYGISVFYNASGAIDYVSVSSGKINGPVTAYSSSFVDGLGLGSDATYMRDGKKVSKSDIAQYDILYYSTTMNTVWSYSKKVTGVFEKASPNKDSVTSITVSGIVYELESAAAMSALSSGGKFELGDTVTLLLGRDGRVADCLDPSGLNEVIYGILKDTGTKEFTDVNGNTKTSYYATVLLPDGSDVTYMAKSKYDSFKNNIVRISVDGGVASVSKATKPAEIYGVLNASKMTLGSSKLASDVKILDVTTTEAYENLGYATVFPSRLDKVSISSGNILYYSKNNAGEIDSIILKNVTGDAYSYGIVQKATPTAKGGVYESVIGSENKTLNSASSKFLVESGQPAKFAVNGGVVASITALTKVSDTVVSVSSTYVETSNRNYLMSDKVVAYNEKYMVVPISDIIGNDNYTVTAYYDKHPDLGGRIRVLKVQEKN